MKASDYAMPYRETFVSVDDYFNYEKKKIVSSFFDSTYFMDWYTYRHAFAKFISLRLIAR